MLSVNELLTRRRRQGRMTLQVVAAALIDGNGRILVQQRPLGKAHAGLWEFPGGKIDPMESPHDALVRELAEELGIAVGAAALEPATFALAPIATGELMLLLFLCRSWSGTPQPLEASALRWVDGDALLALPMPPADVALARRLLPLIG